MSEQKHGPTILATLFMLLTLAFIVMWILANNENDTLSSNLNSARSDRTTARGTIRRLQSETDALRDLIGRGGDATTIRDTVTTMISSEEVTGGATPAASLDAALSQSLDARDTQATGAVTGQINLNNQILELQQTIAARDADIESTRVSLAEVEADLRQREAQHSEQLKGVTSDFNDLRKNFRAVQDEFEAYKENYRAELEARENDIRDKRTALVRLRSRSFKQEELSFDIPDGFISNVDQVAERVYINLGSRDALFPGRTFTVFDIGRGDETGRNSQDIKGEILITDILGPHLSEAHIKSQDRPFSTGDPVYNSTFQSGQVPEIALAGRLEGLDREQVHRLIAGIGARIIVQMTDDGEFIDVDNRPLTKEEAEERFSDRTRFLVIARLGDTRELADEKQQAIFERIEKNTDWMRDAALEHGVYEIGLSQFLDYIGYSDKTR